MGADGDWSLLKVILVLGATAGALGLGIALMALLNTRQSGRDPVLQVDARRAGLGFDRTESRLRQRMDRLDSGDGDTGFDAANLALLQQRQRGTDDDGDTW